MRPGLSLGLVVGLAVAVAGPGRARAGTEREGTRPAPSLAQSLTSKGSAEREPRGAEDGGWRGLTERFLDLFSEERRPTTERGCARGACPSGMQCCCCGDECYCKRECSLRPCR
jgi:hypothetical protein